MCERPGLVLVVGDPLPWPKDLRGQPLPRRPVRGLRVDVQWGESICPFDRWSVVVVTRERFVARNSGNEASGPIDAWGDWLRGLRDREVARRDGREARLSVHWPGCSIGWCSCRETVEAGTLLQVIK